MFDHVTLRVPDLATAVATHGAAIEALGIAPTTTTSEVVVWGGHFAVATVADDRPPSSNAHVAFAARSRDDVQRFWSAGTAAGLADGGAPGLRPQYAENYYAAYLVDAAGNRMEAVHRG